MPMHPSPSADTSRLPLPSLRCCILRSLFDLPVSQFYSAFILASSSKNEDGCELGTDVVCRVTRYAAKERQTTKIQDRSICRARAVIAFFESERHPVVKFVLNVSREEIATATHW